MRWVFANDEHGKGSSDPIVARTIIQAEKLAALYELKEEDCLRIAGIYNEVRRHLHQCDNISKDIVGEINDKYGQLRFEGGAANGDGAIHLPAASNLTNNVETYLYHAKLVFRELKGVFEPTLGKNFKPSTQYEHIADWSAKRFGKDNWLTKWLRDNCAWIEKVVNSRNAIEHPENGSLEVRNFHIAQTEGGAPYIEEPVWSLNKEKPKSLLKDMQVLTSNMLEFSEILLIYCLRNFKNIYPITIAEIPENQRNVDIPLRFMAALEQDVDVNGMVRAESPSPMPPAVC